MLTALLIGLGLAAFTGVIAAAHWLGQPGKGPEWRTYAHGSMAGLVLITLLLGLDHQDPGAGPRLAGIFFTIATGMLLFLQRQRQQRFSLGLLGLHVSFALLAILIVGFQFG